MLTENIPEGLLEWASSLVNNAHDRPWFHEEPPLLAIEHYQPPCRCNKSVKLNKYPCEDAKGFVYLGQCERCETIIWSYKEINDE